MIIDYFWQKGYKKFDANSLTPFTESKALHTVYLTCTNSNNCPFLKENCCLMAHNRSHCIFGTRHIEKGPYPHNTKKVIEWTNIQKGYFGDDFKERTSYSLRIIERDFTLRNSLPIIKLSEDFYYFLMYDEVYRYLDDALPFPKFWNDSGIHKAYYILHKDQITPGIIASFFRVSLQYLKKPSSFKDIFELYLELFGEETMELVLREREKQSSNETPF